MLLFVLADVCASASHPCTPLDLSALVLLNSCSLTFCFSCQLSGPFSVFIFHYVFNFSSCHYDSFEGLKPSFIPFWELPLYQLLCLALGIPWAKMQNPCCLGPYLWLMFYFSYSLSALLFFFKKKKRAFIYLFLERRRDGEREGEKHWYVVVSCMPPSGDPACNPGMCSH